MGVGVLIDQFGAMRTLISFATLSTVLLFVIGEVLASASAEVLMKLLAAGGFFVLGAYGGVNIVLASFYPDKPARGGHRLGEEHRASSEP